MTHVSQLGSQHFQTPPQVCQKMESLLDWEDFTVLEPTPGAGNLSRFLKQKGYTVLVPEGDFWEACEDWQGQKINAVVMNPPFSPMMDAWKCLMKCMEMADHVIAILPWVLLVNSHKRLPALAEYGCKKIYHLPRKAFPGSRVQTCIVDLKRGWPTEPILTTFTW